jgi:heptosyltransferase-2
LIGIFLTITLPTWLALAWRHLQGTQAVAAHNQAPRSILVIRLDQLGDLVLTTPLFRELKRVYPGARLTAAIPETFMGILATNRNVDEILPVRRIASKWLPERVWPLVSALFFYWRRLRHRHFDLVVTPRWDVDENLATLLCALVSASRRVGYSSRTTEAKRKLNRWFDAAFDLEVAPGGLHHELDRNLAIVCALGGDVRSSRLEIRLTDTDREFAKELLRHHDGQRLLVALGIGGRAAGRRWPVERYAQFITELNRYQSVQPVIVCAEQEDREAAALSVKLAVPPYIVRGLPLRLVCAVMERCDLFVGNDSGPAHLSAAMNCATIVISRHPKDGDQNHPNSPARFQPRCDRSRVIQPCHGADECSGYCRSRTPHCILQVRVERVVESALELLPVGAQDFRAECRQRLESRAPVLEPALVALAGEA